MTLNPLFPARCRTGRHRAAGRLTPFRAVATALAIVLGVGPAAGAVRTAGSPCRSCPSHGHGAARAGSGTGALPCHGSPDTAVAKLPCHGAARAERAGAHRGGCCCSHGPGLSLPCRCDHGAARLTSTVAILSPLPIAFDIGCLVEACAPAASRCPPSFGIEPEIPPPILHA